MKELTIKNIDEIKKTAAQFIKIIDNHKVIAFEGKMGAGKTTFIKAICEYLGVEDVVNSPTFSIINEYKSSITNELIYHFDFYRINQISEAKEIGVEDYFYNGTRCFIEWPEKIKQLLPEDTIYINVHVQLDYSRVISILI